MCDQFLSCPSCGAELTASVAIVGDNATGFMVEFFLLTADGDAFVPAVEPEDTARAGAVARTIGASAAVAMPQERGFDDDEAPEPPKQGHLGVR